jgi:sec-independent protein translocase protein TatB
MDSFFGIGIFELVMIAVIALIVMGPERLPGAMREVAKYMRQLREVSNEFQSQFSDELQMLDEINPRRIFDSAVDPKARPTPGAPPGPRAPSPAVGAVPSKPPVAPAAVAVNTILPPPTPEAQTDTASSTLPVEPPLPPPAVAKSEATLPPSATEESAGAEAKQ